MAKTKNKLSLSPQHIDGDTWYYEESKGIDVVRQVRNSTREVIATERFMIPWELLRKSLARKDSK